MALSQLGKAALDRAVATAAEMTRIATTPDERKLAAGVVAIVAKAKALAEGSSNLSTSTGGSQMPLNVQYLELERQMARENQAYTAVSNIMRTKHDTVKNSISNIR